MLEKNKNEGKPVQKSSKNLVKNNVFTFANI